MRRIKLIKKLENGVYSDMDSPVGCLTILASSQGLHNILWENDFMSYDRGMLLTEFKRSPSHDIITQTKRQLAEYFHSKRKSFNLPVVLNGTSFQIQVWQQLSKIPYGQTISYSEQAKRLGDKNKARAVGLANGANPLSIILPCHRVIGAKGQLTGFGGGIDKKMFLLDLEKKVLNNECK